MAKNNQPVAKRCKALGLSPAVLGYSKKTTNRNSQNQTRKKQSEYALQMNEKQKVKFVYGILEKQFRTYYEKAEKMPGKTGENLLTSIERRLDNVVFRLGFARTRTEARQIVDHKHILVNGKVVNIPSYSVKPGDVITVSEKAKNKAKQRFADVLEVTEGRSVPGWLESDKENLSGTVKEYPQRDMIDVPVNEELIVELYSK